MDKFQKPSAPMSPQKSNPRPVQRPVIRPVAPPPRVMPQTPAPVKIVPVKSPVTPPSQGIKPFPRPAALGVKPVPPRPGVTTGAVKPPVVMPAQPRFNPAGTTAAMTFLALNLSAAHADVSSDASFLNGSLNDLQERSSFNRVLSDVNTLDNQVNQALQLLESGREEGYRFQSDLEDKAYDAKGQWDAVKPQVINTVQRQSYDMQTRLPTLTPMVQQLNARLSNPAAARPLIQSTHNQVNTLLQTIDLLERNLQSSYAPLQTVVKELTGRLNRIHWAMDQLKEAKFQLANAEDLVMAVAARWDKEGNDDPEGVLFLSNKRLIFERKEKVATKKILFIATEKQLVQEVLIDQSLVNVSSYKAENKGLFGNQDYLQIAFLDKKFGNVALHINGQDSKEWAGLVEQAKSGKIESERASGAGISLADLTGPLTQADIISVQNDVGMLQEEMMLKTSRESLANLENDVLSLGRNLADVRAKGYVIEKNLEADISILTAQWDRIKANTETTITNQSKLLGTQSQSIQQLTAQLVGKMTNLAAARPLYMQLKSLIASAKTQAEAASGTVSTQYQAYNAEVEGLSAHLDWVNWMLDALSTASFQLLATESGIAATEAVWEKPGLEPENGILFLTDQRLLWEDRVGDFELKFNVPLQLVQDVHANLTETGEREVINFGLASGGPYPNVQFYPSMQVGDEWEKMVGRARSGDYVKDRAVEIDPTEIEKIRKAPQQCSKCGAVFSAPILRGQVEVICEYCGFSTRL